MISSISPVNSAAKTVNDIPSWGPVALSEIGNLGLLLAQIASEQGQSPSNEKLISSLVTQLNTLKGEVESGTISQGDFENQINSIINQVEQLPPPSEK